jgi:hypothetical protein
LVITSTMSPASSSTSNASPAAAAGTSVPASTAVLGVISTVVPSKAAATVRYAPCPLCGSGSQPTTWLT